MDSNYSDEWREVATDEGEIYYVNTSTNGELVFKLFNESIAFIYNKCGTKIALGKKSNHSKS